MLELRNRRRCLQFAEAQVAADRHVFVGALHALVSKDAQAVSEVGVGCGEQPSLTRRDILRGVEGERSQSKPAHRFSVDGRAMSLSSIFDHREAVRRCQLHDRGHVCR